MTEPKSRFITTTVEVEGRTEQRTVAFCKVKIANLAAVVITDLACGGEEAAALAREMRLHQLSVFATRIDSRVDVRSRSTGQGAYDILDKAQRQGDKLRANLKAGIWGAVVEAVEMVSTCIVMLENRRVEFLFGEASLQSCEFSLHNIRICDFKDRQVFFRCTAAQCAHLFLIST